MRVFETNISPAFLLACMCFLGCEKPDLEDPEDLGGADQEVAGPSLPLTEPDEKEVPPVVETVEAVEEAKEATPKTEAALPKLSVKKEDGNIVIEGTLKSSSHKERIREQMERAFPDLEIVDHVEVDLDTIPVGWTSRVAEQLLIPFFQEVEDPYLDWIDGKITVRGTVRSQMAKRDLSILAIDTFVSVYSQDIDNQLEVAGE